jgi:hypothetical protein
LLHSERIYNDLFSRLLAHEHDFSMKIVVRKWYDILPEWEFKCFIYARKLTAISQYHSIFVPEIVKKKAVIEKNIRNFFNSIRRLIKEENYIIDIAIMPERIYLVDLNHWIENDRYSNEDNSNHSMDRAVKGTSGLFDWNNVKDKEILTGVIPFEFRILETKPKYPKLLLGPNERNLMIVVGEWELAVLEEESKKYKEEIASRNSCFLS